MLNVHFETMGQASNVRNHPQVDFFRRIAERGIEKGSSWGIMWRRPAGTNQMFFGAVHLPISPLLFSSQDGTFLWGQKWTTCPTRQRRRTSLPRAYSVHSSGGAWLLLQTARSSGFQLLCCLENKGVLCLWFFLLLLFFSLNIIQSNRYG